MTTETYQTTLVMTALDGQSETITQTHVTTYLLTLMTSSTAVSSVSLSDLPVSSTGAIETTDTPAAENNAWIAGPVVGSICAIILLSFGWWFLRRRKRHHALLPTADNKKERFEKAELHAEDAPQIPPTELEGSYPDPVPEMSANEIAAQEMLSSELRSPVEMPERQK
ncbi:hypothetical protein GCG54_00009318 [Colletotrichum gloeosporioides]|uniref:Uncharacterized protein n=1 Tax=Colletotrichum gloeosporioides TaxID=474922 RepID=A0A8H4C4Z3_COLGL|nr:uncharacterized protein GCG54_00009318 [Colletotrichum gloeosporioides]KAF3797347.1 hypothetical protein GCG54_00009318 [Colletotrichum gloeosporioides]